MRLSNIKVEQVTNTGEIVDDYGEILSRSDINEIFITFFKKVSIKGNLIYGNFDGKEYCVFSKNISYLGIPHPLHKKRIQIPVNFKSVYDENMKNGIETVLLGVYKYKDNVLFCDFDTTKYVNNRINNSSAHVYSIDLLNGLKQGLFRKKDLKGNIITVFSSNKTLDFLKTKFLRYSSPTISVFDTLDDFFINVTKEWMGIDAYTEMITSDYHNKFQSEWPGIYLEFKFEQYLKKNKSENIISFYQDKKSEGIDLDLIFPTLNTYGDLKAHSLNVSGIQGNDYDTIMNLLDNQSIYYIVANHSTEKDKDHNFEVTKFWNKSQNKSNLMSYSNKMKYSVTIKSYSILELNKYNKKYIGIYNQGKNSNGKPREPKINIKEKDIPNFLVHNVDFEDDI